MNFRKKKVTRLILTLSSKEEVRFKQFLSSPYFVGPEYQIILSRLFEFLIIQLKQSCVEEIEESAIARTVFNDEQIIQGKCDKFLSMLYKHLLKFIGLEASKNSEYFNLITTAELRTRGEYTIWKNHFNKTRKKIVKDKNGSKEEGFDILRMALEKFDFENLEPRKTSRESYLEIFDALDNFYLDHMLRIGIQLLANNKFIVPLEVETRFNTLQLLLSERKDLAGSGLNLLKKQIFYILNDLQLATEESISQILRSLAALQSEIPQVEYVYLRYIARSLVIHLYNLGKESAMQHLFDMYQEDVINGTIFYNSKLPASTLNNITTAALRVNETDWIKNFLDLQKDNILEGEIAQFIVNLNLSKVYFAEGEFEKALDAISFEVKDFYLKINARILEVMIYYELKSDQLAFKLEAYKLFIHRLPTGKMPDKFIKAYNNFVDILKSIHHPRTAFDIPRMQRIQSKIKKTTALAEKDWLLGKIDELLLTNKQKLI